MNLADALITKRFNRLDRIIKQGTICFLTAQWELCFTLYFLLFFLYIIKGDVADGMYFIEEGTVVIKMDQGGSEIEISKLTKGEYFGELALVTHRPRAASVYAEGEVKVACK